jgi:hypothetical protein
MFSPLGRHTTAVFGGTQINAWLTRKAHHGTCWEHNHVLGAQSRVGRTIMCWEHNHLLGAQSCVGSTMMCWAHNLVLGARTEIPRASSLAICPDWCTPRWCTSRWCTQVGARQLLKAAPPFRHTAQRCKRAIAHACSNRYNVVPANTSWRFETSEVFHTTDAVHPQGLNL